MVGTMRGRRKGGIYTRHPKYGRFCPLKRTAHSTVIVEPSTVVTTCVVLPVSLVVCLCCRFVVVLGSEIYRYLQTLVGCCCLFVPTCFALFWVRKLTAPHVCLVHVVACFVFVLLAGFPGLLEEILLRRVWRSVRWCLNWHVIG